MDREGDWWKRWGHLAPLVDGRHEDGALGGIYQGWPVEARFYTIARSAPPAHSYKMALRVRQQGQAWGLDRGAIEDERPVPPWLRILFWPLLIPLRAVWDTFRPGAREGWQVTLTGDRALAARLGTAGALAALERWPHRPDPLIAYSPETGRLSYTEIGAREPTIPDAARFCEQLALLARLAEINAAANTIPPAPWLPRARLALALATLAATLVCLPLGVAAVRLLSPRADEGWIVALLVWVLVIVLGLWGEAIRVGITFAERVHAATPPQG